LVAKRVEGNEGVPPQKPHKKPEEAQEMQVAKKDNATDGRKKRQKMGDHCWERLAMRKRCGERTGVVWGWGRAGQIVGGWAGRERGRK